MTNLKLSDRLKTIANMIDQNSTVYDIGCDHGFLDIFLTEYKNCSCIASDISENVLINTKNNISKYNLEDKIKIICSDGLNNLDINNEDIVVISGMGTNTIINILNNEKIKNINNLIIQSNNDIEILRREVVVLGFYIFDEKIVNDNNKDYVIIYFKKGYKKYSNADYLFGPIARKDLNNFKYFQNIYEKNKIIYKKITYKQIFKKISRKKYIKKLKKFTVL